MLRFRTLLLWLMMLALPLQGFAAASMLFCGMGASGSSNLVLVSPAMEHHAADEGFVQHEHSGHMGMAETAPQSPDVQKHFTDATHKCGICAACCSAVWINDLPVSAAAGSPPPSDLAEPVVLIQVVTSRLPEKPPRA